MSLVAMKSREMSVLTLIYARRPAANQVLLGMKKRGFGAGKFNGFGGKLEPGESLEESASRELQEECGVVVGPAGLRWCGTLIYIYDTKPKGMEVHVFDLEAWEGQPEETEEMRPQWFHHDEIPLKDMWADDQFWLVQYLDGELQIPFRGRFRFKGHEGDDSWVVLESQVSHIKSQVPRCPATSSTPAPGSALVVSTVSFLNAPGGCGRSLESFIRYHLLKGIARIMIVIDDPRDEVAASAVKKFPAALVITRVRGEELLEEQRTQCASFPDLEPVFEEVSARQMLDAELAMALAPSLGCSWVLCLDSDELFFTAEESVVPHFEALAEAGVDQMTYLNHEGVPEVEETADYFATTTLFRRHHFAVPLSAGAREGLHFWMNRSRRRQYLLFYDNGKSACRSGINGAKPQSQHLWRLPDGSRSCTALADPRRLDVEGYRDCNDPCILHFPVCGVSWLHAKYRTLGAFSDSWLGGKVKLPASFHSDAREACAAGRGELDELFRREVLLDDVGEIERQLACGTCLRIVGHAALLEAVVYKDDSSCTDASQVAEGADAAVATADAPATAARRCGATPAPAPAPLDAGPQGIERGWILSKAMGFL